MRVFISSVISGFESYRDAAASAVEDLGYEVIRAEDFGASVSSPQEACLEGVRQADATIVLLGERYGAKQASGISATHEEYREAQGRQPILAFVKQEAGYEPAQAVFIGEVRAWETGRLTVRFSTEEELRSAVTRGLHDYVVSAASSSVDEEDLLARAEAGVGAPRFWGGHPEVVLSLAAGPRTEILRPSELEGESFARKLQQEALFGPHSFFAAEAGAPTTLRGDWLVASQEGASVGINSAGDMVVRQSAVARDRGFFEVPALIEEDAFSCLAGALKFSNAVLAQSDSARRVTHIAVVAALTAVGSQTWRTREQHAHSPRSGALEVGHGRAVVHLHPAVRARAELSQRAEELAHDLMVLLRRELKR